jgi:hypothetical protein
MDERILPFWFLNFLLTEEKPRASAGLGLGFDLG